MKRFTVIDNDGDANEGCWLNIGEYGDGHIALTVNESDGGVFGDITVYVWGMGIYKPDMSCIDTRNNAWVADLIEQLGIGRDTGLTLRQNGYEYHVYEFDRTAIEKYVGG